MKQLPPGYVQPPSASAAAGARAAGSVRKLAVPVAIAIALLFGANKLLHHENRYEKLATDVTKALAANDMRPVEKDFNAITRAKLADRGKVGTLSDFVNAEGALASMKEDTPSGSNPNFHHFVATFKNGKRAEDLTVDNDGKIADFHVRPSAE
jgi:hypothetical protein